QFLAREDDVVLVERRPCLDFLSRVKDAGFPLPEFVEIGPSASQPASEGIERLAERKIGALRPWAWSPDSVELLRRLMANVTSQKLTPERCFNEGIAELYSKAWSAKLLRRFLHSWPTEPWLCRVEEVGVEVTTLDQALKTITEIRSRGHHRIVVKEFIGLAGHNAIRLWEPEVQENQRRWMKRALKIGPVIVEPWLERELDFSIQLEMASDKLRVCGYTGLINDLRGQFQGNWAEPNAGRRQPSDLGALFDRPALEQIERGYETIFAQLQGDLRQRRYQGPLGIDAFAYRTQAGSLRLKPIVEINPRYTMGR